MIHANTNQTTLDLNGPILSFTQHPSAVSVANAGIATFVGIATATFPVQVPSNPATNTGIITYRWYDANGALSDGATVTGSATTTLTLSNVISPTDSGRLLYVKADYIPSAYNTTGVTTVGTARSTGNAINEPVDSNTALLTVFPLVSFTTQPTSKTAAQTITTTFTVEGASSDGGSVSYQWNINGTPVNNGSNSISGATFIVSGATTPTLSVSGDTIGTFNITSSISYSTATNSPRTSDTAVFTVVAARKIVNVETVNQLGTSSASLSSTNVFNQNLTLSQPSGAPQGTIFSLYAPETDIDIFIDMYAAAGSDYGGYKGGQGGVSTIRLTLQKNVEYVVSALPQATGGAAVFLWRKASLIACAGGGGNAGTSGDGGDGGGVNVPGASGTGRGAGSGGILYAPGTLPTTVGSFGSLAPNPPGGTFPGDGRPPAPLGGRVLGCTKGGNPPSASSYWLDRGYSPCQDVGVTQLVSADGIIITNTAYIQRGHKVGYACRQTAGAGLNGGGNGANGATGGNGGDGGGGGGGGGGYTDGSVTIVSTRQGGNTGTPRVVIRNAS